MKRLIAFLLVGAAMIDIVQQAYSTDLLGSIEKRPAGTNILAVIAHSEIVRTIEYWGLFLIGFGILSLAMSAKKSKKPATTRKR